MDQTIRKQDDVATTIRVGTPQVGLSGGDATIRPGGGPSVEKGAAADFVLKGKVYHSVKCLSDNSGEAQVFLVESDGEEMVLKIYYPNFTIKKTLMRIIQNLNMEMIV